MYPLICWNARQDCVFVAKADNCLLLQTILRIVGLSSVTHGRKHDRITVLGIERLEDTLQASEEVQDEGSHSQR